MSHSCASRNPVFSCS